MTKITLLLCTILCSFCSFAFGEDGYLYKVSLVQAAPGKLPEVIDLYKTRFAELKSAGDEMPLWMRHSQGDHWDLMILFPMGSYASYYQANRILARGKADQRVATGIKQDIA